MASAASSTKRAVENGASATGSAARGTWSTVAGWFGKRFGKKEEDPAPNRTPIYEGGPTDAQGANTGGTQHNASAGGQGDQPDGATPPPLSRTQSLSDLNKPGQQLGIQRSASMGDLISGQPLSGTGSLQLSLPANIAGNGAGQDNSNGNGPVQAKPVADPASPKGETVTSPKSASPADPPPSTALVKQGQLTGEPSPSALAWMKAQQVVAWFRKQWADITSVAQSAKAALGSPAGPNTKQKILSLTHQPATSSSGGTPSADTGHDNPAFVGDDGKTGVPAKGTETPEETTKPEAGPKPERPIPAPRKRNRKASESDGPTAAKRRSVVPEDKPAQPKQQTFELEGDELPSLFEGDELEAAANGPALWNQPPQKGLEGLKKLNAGSTPFQAPAAQQQQGAGQTKASAEPGAAAPVKPETVTLPEVEVDPADLSDGELIIGGSTPSSPMQSDAEYSDDEAEGSDPDSGDNEPDFELDLGASQPNRPKSWHGDSSSTALLEETSAQSRRPSLGDLMKKNAEKDQAKLQHLSEKEAELKAASADLSAQADKRSGQVGAHRNSTAALKAQYDDLLGGFASADAGTQKQAETGAKPKGRPQSMVLPGGDELSTVLASGTQETVVGGPAPLKPTTFDPTTKETPIVDGIAGGRETAIVDEAPASGSAAPPAATPSESPASTRSSSANLTANPAAAWAGKPMAEKMAGWNALTGDDLKAVLGDHRAANKNGGKAQQDNIQTTLNTLEKIKVGGSMTGLGGHHPAKSLAAAWTAEIQNHLNNGQNDATLTQVATFLPLLDAKTIKNALDLKKGFFWENNGHGIFADKTFFGIDNASLQGLKDAAKDAGVTLRYAESGNSLAIDNLTAEQIPNLVPTIPNDAGKNVDSFKKMWAYGWFWEHMKKEHSNKRTSGNTYASGLKEKTETLGRKAASGAKTAVQLLTAVAGGGVSSGLQKQLAPEQAKSADRLSQGSKRQQEETAAAQAKLKAQKEAGAAAKTKKSNTGRFGGTLKRFGFGVGK